MIKAAKIKTKSRVFHVEFLKLDISDDDLLVKMKVDIQGMLLKLFKVEVKERGMTISGERIRLQEILQIQNLQIPNNLWLLKFIKFKDLEMLGIASEDGGYNEDELEEMMSKVSTNNNKKYLASPTICLYDPKKDVFIISRNSEGVSISEILEFLKRKFKNDKLELYPVIKNKNITSNSVKNYRNLQLGISGIQDLEPKTIETLKKQPSLWGAIEGVKKIGSDNANINTSMQKNSDKGFNENVGKEIFAISRYKISNIKNLKMTVKLDDSTKVETIDFLQERLLDKFTLRVPRNSLIKSEDVKNYTINSYLKKYDEIR
ncbi:MAG: DUF6731 family protein [Sarcina sp.]